MPFISGADRSEVLLFPAALDDYITPDNPVRFIDAFVSALDLAELGLSRPAPAETGRPAYHPADLLRLYIYGYLNRVRSSRLLERETQRNIEVIWLMRKLTPDHKTIANFRKDNSSGLKAVCREFTLLCRKMELFGAELVAVDGSKFRADNSRQNNYNQQKLERLIQVVDQRIERYLQELEEQDAAEPERVTVSAAELPAKIEQLKERKAHYQQLTTQLQESGEKQLSTIDPDARLMLDVVSTEVCYNVQMVVDSKHKLIITHEVANDVTDKNQLSGMALKAQEALGVERLEVVADMGYFDGSEVKKCLAAGITPYVSKPDTSANKKRGLYTKDEFAYDKEKDCYICPQGEELSYRFATLELGRHIRYYATPACQDCPVRGQCTRAKEEGRKGRRITRWVDEHLLEEMAERVRARPEVMRRRKEIVEHPFGTMKRGMQMGYFLTRGLKKVSGEMSLTVLSYNLKRVLNILGTKRLMEAVG
jgi:transposase